MRGFFIVLALVIGDLGCAYQMRGDALPHSESSKDSPSIERENEPLSIGPIEPLPPKGPVPELQIGMSQHEVQETLAKYGMGGIPTMVQRSGETTIVYGIGRRDVVARFDTFSRRLKRYTVTDPDGYSMNFE